MSRAAQARTKVGSTLIGLTFEGSSHESLGRGCLPSEWAPHILKPAYDERPVYAKEKSEVTVAMAMTEKQRWLRPSRHMGGTSALCANASHHDRRDIPADCARVFLITGESCGTGAAVVDCEASGHRPALSLHRRLRCALCAATPYPARGRYGCTGGAGGEEKMVARSMTHAVLFCAVLLVVIVGGVRPAR